MRGLIDIAIDINRCNAQILAAYTPGETITKQSQDVIEAFQTKLDQLNAEYTTARIINSKRFMGFKFTKNGRQVFTDFNSFN
jgi:hypothetical protein